MKVHIYIMCFFFSLKFRAISIVALWMDLERVTMETTLLNIPLLWTNVYIDIMVYDK